MNIFGIHSLRSGGDPRTHLRRLAALALAGGLAAGGTACSSGEAAEDESAALQTAEAFRKDLRISVEATGQVEPIRNVEVKSMASGEIIRLHADVGDRVEQGQLLAEVNPRDVRNEYNQAVADLEVAKARLEIAEAQLLRSQELLEAEVITAQENETRNLEFANAKAQLVKAEASLELAELRLSDVTIRAPMSGTVLARNVEEGTVIQSASGNVSGGTTLFLMANLDAMQVRTMVDETDMGEISGGLPAVVQVEAFPGRNFQGEVEKIEPQAVIEQSVTMFPVIVRLDNRSGLLRPGMNSEVEVMISQRTNTVVVPNNAIVKFQDMAAAAEVLGLDPEAIDIDRSTFAALTAQLRGEDPGAAVEAAQAAGGAGGGPPMDFAQIREKIQSGEISRDSARALFQAMRAQGGGGFGAAGGGAPNAQTGAPQPGVAFVVSASGAIEPRPVLIGLNDWDHTEILAGLEEGEQVAVIGVAALRAQQQQRLEFFNRMRGNSGLPGIGG